METLIGSTKQSDIKSLQTLHQQTQSKMRNVIADFQFYHRMTQRLQHIMGTIQDAIKTLEVKASGNEAEWHNIFERIEKSYTMREVKLLFDSIRSGEGFESAVSALIEKTFKKEAVQSEIELF